MSMPECPAPGWPLYTRPLPKRPLMRPFTGQMKGAAKSARSSSRVRAALTCACSRRMRSAIAGGGRSEEHTSELQSLMRSSYAVFCLKKKKQKQVAILRKTTADREGNHKSKLHIL